jgi:hypothetical protein
MFPRVSLEEFLSSMSCEDVEKLQMARKEKELSAKGICKLLRRHFQTLSKSNCIEYGKAFFKLFDHAVTLEIPLKAFEVLEPDPDFPPDMLRYRPKNLTGEFKSQHASLAFYRDVIYHHYPHTIPDEFHQLLTELMKKYRLSDVVSREYCRDILRLQSALCDSHSFTFMDYGHAHYGVTVEWTSSGWKITRGDDVRLIGSTVTHVNGRSMEEEYEKYKSFCHGSHDNIRRQWFASRTITVRSSVICDDVPDVLSLTLENRGTVQLSQKPVDLEPECLAQEGNVLHPKSPYFKNENVVIFPTMVIDLREYPSQTMEWSQFFERLNNSGRAILFGRYFECQLTPHTYLEFPLCIDVPSNSEPDRIVKEIVVLVDHTSVSQSEHHAMLLQELCRATNRTFHRHHLGAGNRTAGANGEVVNIPLLHGVEAQVNLNYVTFPDYRPLQRNGV